MPVVIASGTRDINKTSVLWRDYTSDLTAGNSLSGQPAINVTDPATYNSWRAVTGVGAVLNYDFRGPVNVSGIGIAAHDMGSLGATVTVAHSSNGASWTDILSYSPSTDDDIMIVFNTIRRRYFRLVFTGARPSIGVVKVSDRLVFPCTPVDDYTPTHHAKIYEKLFNSSITGQFLGNRVLGAGGATSAQFPLVDRDFVDGPLVGFKDHYDRGGTFFYAGWPEGKPQDIAYCRAGSQDGSVSVTYTNADKLASVEFGMETYVNT